VTIRLRIINKNGLELGATFLEARTNMAFPTAANKANEKELVNKFFNVWKD
jgi:hypothetical protein